MFLLILIYFHYIFFCSVQVIQVVNRPIRACLTDFGPIVAFGLQHGAIHTAKTWQLNWLNFQWNQFYRWCHTHYVQFLYTVSGCRTHIVMSIWSNMYFFLTFWNRNTPVNTGEKIRFRLFVCHSCSTHLNIF